MDYSNGAKKIAKNTLLLYVRLAVLLLVGLYTSRVVLGALGESDYGIYNVVGGVVAMFSIISGALSSAISRFITFELGRGGSRLGAIFRCAVFVQIVLALIVVAVGEPLGLWFIGEKMTIPPERVAAAQIVLQFSLITFVINLLSVPYNATIIAHESMGHSLQSGCSKGLRSPESRCCCRSLRLTGWFGMPCSCALWRCVCGSRMPSTAGDILMNVGDPESRDRHSG